MNFFQIDSLPPYTVSLVFILKVIAGFGLTYIYTYHYGDRATADIYKYFDDSLVLHKSLFKNPKDYFQMMFGIFNDNEYFTQKYYSEMSHWARPFANHNSNDTHIIIRFNALARLLSFGYFSLHTIFINFLTVVGIIAFYRSFIRFKSVDHFVFFFGLALLPSILFWGSGVLKEGIIIFALGLLFLNLFREDLKPMSWVNYLMIILTTYLLIRLKFYLVIALIPGLLAYWYIKKTQSKLAFLWHLVTILFFLGVGLNLKYLSPELDLLHLIAQKQKDFICLASFMNSGSYISIPLLNEDPINFLSAIPNGIYNVLFKPDVFSSKGSFMFLTGLENLLLILSISLSLLFKKPNKMINWNLMWFALSFTGILYAMVGVSTPVLGALVRYKVPGLLFVVLAISILLDREKLNAKISAILKK